MPPQERDALFAALNAAVSKPFGSGSKEPVSVPEEESLQEDIVVQPSPKRVSTPSSPPRIYSPLPAEETSRPFTVEAFQKSNEAEKAVLEILGTKMFDSLLDPKVSLERIKQIWKNDYSDEITIEELLTGIGILVRIGWVIQYKKEVGDKTILQYELSSPVEDIIFELVADTENV